MSGEEKPDLRLRVFIWGIDGREDPRIEFFESNEWGKAIDRARELAESSEKLSRLQVVDAWGMLIAQFCARFTYAPWLLEGVR